jgi:hypothetical protein
MRKKIQIEFEFQELINLSEIVKKRLFVLYDLLAQNDVIVENLSRDVDKVIEKFEKMKPERVVNVFKIDEILGYLREFKQLKEFLKKIENVITGGYK